MKVLIVDDRVDNQLLLQEQLRILDAIAVTADSGVRALRELRSQSFDLVITDLLMPEMDGFQLCYLLKTDPDRKNTPVVIYTANYATKKDEQQAKDLGADDFITRPIEEEQLAERIRRVMQRARAGDVAEPRSKPQEGFFREYSSLLIEKLEDQLITAEENARLLVKNSELQREVADKNDELNENNKELTRLNEDLEAFSYSVSHDLRAPVRAIEGMLDVLVEELGTLTPGAQRYVDRIKYNVNRMNALITGLLEHSRMRNIGAATTTLDLEAIVAAAVAGLDYAIRESGATVTVTGPLPPVVGHEQALVQIVTNLVDNGLKFVKRGTVPHVTISAESEDGRVRLSFRDNGIGISPAHQARLFKVFERLHPAADYPGSGLGLAIVQRGIERMGGRVGLESEVNVGTTFWIELEAADSDVAKS
jgi:signal transduction histidine kinase